MATLPGFSHVITYSLAGVTSKALSGKITASGTAEDGRSITIPATTTNQTILFSVKYTALTSFFLLASGDLTVKTNSSGGTDVIDVKNGVPIVYQSGTGQTNPFTADVVSLYMTNAGAAAVVLDVATLQQL